MPIEDMERLEEQAKAYRINRFEVDTLRQRKIELDEREKALEKTRQAATQMYGRQKNINQLLDLSDRKVSSLNHENGSLRALLDDRDKTIGELQERLKTALQSVRGAYDTLTNVVKAVGMLKYDKNGSYRANLTEDQGRLIDAITKYSSRSARADGHPDLAKSMEEVGISLSIREDIQSLTPKNPNGRGGGGRGR